MPAPAARDSKSNDTSAVVIPAYWEYMQPTLSALHDAGGTAGIQDLLKRVPIIMNLSAAQLAIWHDDEGRVSEVAYRLAWARTYLKYAGLVHNQDRGIWTLTETGWSTPKLTDPKSLALELARTPRATNDGTGEAEEDYENVYLFAWNPLRFLWNDLDADIAMLRETGGVDGQWSCGQSKTIPPGSRFYLIRLASEPRGIVGSGVTIGDVYEKPHWDADRAAQGDSASFVDIRFDALARSPIIRRLELDEAPFEQCHWDTQSSGIHIPAAIARTLEATWTRRLRGSLLPEAVPLQAIERWREYWLQTSSDNKWRDQHRLRDQQRVRALPQICELIQGFVSGGLTLESFNATFDRKTRNEWDVFGLKGHSGAAFVTRLAKVSDRSEVTQRLQRALSLPETPLQASEKLREFIGYLQHQNETGTAAALGIQPNRATFLLSASWHMQAPDRWPVFYLSARKALQADGLLGRRVEGADGYLEFARLFDALAKGLELPYWDLEHLCDARANANPEDDSAVDADETARVQRVWLLSAGAESDHFETFFSEGIIGIGWSNLGDLTQYRDRKAVRDALQQDSGGDTNPVQSANMCFQFVQDMEVGDELFLKRGRDQILGYGVISSAYRYEPTRDQWKHVRSVDWKKRGTWTVPGQTFVAKRLTNIGEYAELVSAIRKAVDLETIAVEVAPSLPPYGIEDALADLLLPEHDVREALELLKHRQNLVLQGPPGVGKTLVAKRLAYLLLEEKDPDRVTQVQFHQSYSYEDFIQGYRPTGNGSFERVDGPFVRFCDRARQDPTSAHVFIIDEINRGNLSKIFGELMLLIEPDKRSEGAAVQLTYSRAGEREFYVPKNLFVIGTMNTADRSLALVDYALRRRFVFVDLQPNFGEPFLVLLQKLGVDRALVVQIQDRIGGLNHRIADDPQLGRGFCIGHSYFCQAGDLVRDRAWYSRIVRTELAPMLREYWFDDRKRADEEAQRLALD